LGRAYLCTAIYLIGTCLTSFAYPSYYLEYGSHILKVDSNPRGGDIFIDGVLCKAKTPLVITNLEPGSHEVEIHLTGYDPYSKMINTRMENEIDADLVPIEKRLTIKSIPNGAQVRINGRLIGNAPIDENLKSGIYSIALNLDGYESITKEINISQPETSLTINLNKLKSQFVIESNPPGADIYIDGTGYGSTPKTIDIGPGLHKIELKLEGYKPWVENKVVSSPIDTLDALIH
jgi:PEGA domain